MKNVNFFVGVDIANKTFVSTILVNPSSSFLSQEFSNNEDGFNSFHQWLNANNVNESNSVIIMETSGVYTERLCYFMQNKNYLLCVENALKVKKAFDETKSRNDFIDSRKIAEYGYRFSDKLKIWSPPESVVEQIKTLLSLRELIVEHITANKNGLKAVEKKYNNQEMAISIYQNIIDNLNNQITEIEKEIDRLISTNSNLHLKYELVKSVPGIGKLFSLNLLVYTNGFSDVLNHKKLSSFIGLCPVRHTSGTSVNKRKRNGGPNRLRKVIYMASMSAIRTKTEFRKYYLRKIAEGKPARLVLNNIANKMIKIVCGILNSGKKYIPGFISIPPHLI